MGNRDSALEKGEHLFALASMWVSLKDRLSQEQVNTLSILLSSFMVVSLEDKLCRVPLPRASEWKKIFRISAQAQVKKIQHVHTMSRNEYS